VLDDGEKTRLASVVAELRRVEADLARSRRELVSVEAALKGLAHGGDWRDRVLDGLARQDSEAAVRPRDAHRSRKRLIASVAQLEDQVKDLAGQADDILDPILRKTDVRYQRLLMARKRCDRALAGCSVTSRAAASASQEARTVLKALSANPASDAGRRYNVEHAAGRYDDLAREIRKQLPDLIHATGEARVGVTAAATGTAPAPTPALDTSLLDALPAATSSVADRFRIGDAIRILGLLTRDITVMEATVRSWRKITDDSRHAILRRSRDLVN
jgi:hypothetical protein